MTPPQRGAPAAGRGRGGAPAALKPGDWNTVELLAAFNPQAPEGERIASQPPAPHLFKASLNGASVGNATLDPAGFGAIALCVGVGEVHYKDVSLRDLGVLTSPKETVSPYFTMQRVTISGAGRVDVVVPGALRSQGSPRHLLRVACRRSRQFGSQTTKVLASSTSRSGSHPTSMKSR